MWRWDLEVCFIEWFPFQVSIDHSWNSLIDSIISKNNKSLENYRSACCFQCMLGTVSTSLTTGLHCLTEKSPLWLSCLLFLRQTSRVNLVLYLYWSVSKLAFSWLMKVNRNTDPPAKVKQCQFPCESLKELKHLKLIFIALLWQETKLFIFTGNKNRPDLLSLLYSPRP